MVAAKHIIIYRTNLIRSLIISFSVNINTIHNFVALSGYIRRLSN